MEVADANKPTAADSQSVCQPIALSLVFWPNCNARCPTLHHFALNPAGSARLLYAIEIGHKIFIVGLCFTSVLGTRMCLFKHTYVHKYMRIHAHTHTHTYRRTIKFKCRNSHSHRQWQFNDTHMFVCICVYMYACMYASVELCPSLCVCLQ